ncbi:MarR family transcriptional regulator [Rhodococcus sp. KBW08]|uniref:MarR family winged helix-turn-helix transcriptional regulator n=1 Tax=unclassified Rhodococcus (in: high G+C Gram-positive bacteria) TaxID=192944 RepID=UPI000F595A45|nr:MULTISPECIES: MarR family transcriptional regulator [unclassified Rhodococcus (in: high G+C Gram-positive bacteria)]MBJ7478410.1 MarR family transcriptional regulator [Rhodococcus sp. (in: high G+C Gram-positive bacteria)]QQM20643.1 MarR family transcriptional regulator [Rhodococcus sp. P-2]RQO44456.1 MarR family transcriptional regulator [Rhodococcus sp. KBW08]
MEATGTNADRRGSAGTNAERSKRTADEAMEPVLAMFDQYGSADDPPAARLGLLALWLADDIIGSVNRSLEPFEISERKLDVLLIFAAQAISDTDEPYMRQTPSGISDYFGISRASATGVLDWLEKREFVERTRTGTDRRSTPIQITEIGKGTVAETVPAFEEACRGLLAPLSDRDRKDLGRILGKWWTHFKDPDTTEG